MTQFSDQFNFVGAQETALQRERALRKAKAYYAVSLQIFSVDYTWLDASHYVFQTDYTFPLPFAFLFPITPPTGVNFCLIVNAGGTRYKLWENVGEEVFFPLYAGELITASFSLECWTTVNNTTISNEVALLFLTSIRVNLTDISESNTEVDAGSELEGDQLNLSFN